jgi:putative transposase
MGQGDLRKGRISLSGQYYHVTINTDRRIRLFTNLGNCRPIAHVLLDIEKAGLVFNYAWVLMPDHLHWIFKLGENVSLSEVVRRFKGRSSHYIHRDTQHFGAVWQRAFFDHAIRGDEDLRQMAEYAIENPVRARLVDDIGQYPFWNACWLD